MSAEVVLGSIVAAVAVYGAALSTMTFRAQRHQHRARIRVSVSNGFPVLGGRVGEPQLQIEATNIGERPVVLEAAGYKLPRKGESLALIDPSLRTLPQFPASCLRTRAACSPRTWPTSPAAWPVPATSAASSSWASSATRRTWSTWPSLSTST